MPESLESFLGSFSYGSRTNLNFKFLARMEEQAGAETVRRLLESVGLLLDDGDPTRIIDLFIEAQTATYSTRPLDSRYHYDEAPFHRPAAPLAGSKVALLTSSGHFAADDDPRPFGIEGMTQDEAVRRIDDFIRERPVLSQVPIDTPPEQTSVRHGGYDVSGSAADRNVSFPVDRLQELAEAGVIGELHRDAFSFVGAASQIRLLKKSAPEWADLLLDHEVDVALLVPV